MFNSKITSFGAYLPEKVVTNEDLSLFLDTSDEWIKTRTGISQRRITVDENTSQLCAKAANRILENASVDSSEIDMIIVATFTPDYGTPSTACLVQALIGASNAVAYDINAACSGFVYALSIADKFIRTGACKNVLVIGGEVISKHVDWEDRKTAILFGDGAGGVLLQRGERKFILSEHLKSDGVRAKSIQGNYSPVKNKYSNNDNIVEEPYLFMDGRAMFDFVTRTLPHSIEYVLKEAELSFSDIKYIVPHQANERLVEAIAKKLGIGMEKIFMNIDKFGNTSAASIPIALNEMYENGLISLGSNEKIILVGFGAGLTWGSLLLQI